MSKYSAKRRVYRCLNRGQSGHRESDYEIDEGQYNRCDEAGYYSSKVPMIEYTSKG